MTTLRKGSTGTEVRELQELLNRHGAGLTVDGIFGNGTQTAVINFQKKNGLTPDGIAGPKTWEALYSSTQSVIKLVNDCVRDIQNLPSFKKFMELIVND